MLFIIGSGPAGIACALGLLERGYQVTMLDAGVDLETEKTKLLQKYQSLTALELQSLRQVFAGKNLLKKPYDSDFPYAQFSNHFNMRSEYGVEVLPSLAKGGLSNAWGAYCDTYSTEEFSGWPISAKDLEVYYQKVFSILPVATVADSSAHAENQYQMSSQAHSLWQHLLQHQRTINDYGFAFQPAKLATTFTSENLHGCNYCGACQYGCPRSLIYSSRSTLSQLLAHANFTYIPDQIVNDIFEDTNSIQIHTQNRETHAPSEYQASYVFSACGPIVSTLLLLRYKKYFDLPIKFQNSTHFMLPCLLKKPGVAVQSEKLHTLCQLTLSLQNPNISNEKIHMQIYSYMDHYATALKRYTKWLPFNKKISQYFLNRLVIIQGFLHSHESESFNMQLNAAGKITLQKNQDGKSSSVIRKLKKFLANRQYFLGITPLSFMLTKSHIGKSFHFGGSLPMREFPGEMETDIFGKPFGLKRWHIVDASIFPTIPANSITPTIMANAYRIARECDIYE